MLSRNQIKFIQSLKIKKYRQKRGVFIAEGIKIVAEILQSKLKVQHLYAVASKTEKQPQLHQLLQNKAAMFIKKRQMDVISLLKTPSPVLAIVQIPDYDPKVAQTDNYWLVLDAIRDPGNLGTLLRIADWFGLAGVLCSPDCVDVYNPKVIQAGMGAVVRVPIKYLNLKQLFENNPQLPVYGAVLNGTNLFETAFSGKGFLLIGNEAHGIQPDLLPHITHAISIRGGGGAESLNAAVAAGIVCAVATR